MNRTLTNVLFGGINAPVAADHKMEGTITKTSVDETVDALLNSENVILVRLQRYQAAMLVWTNTRAFARWSDTVWLWRRLSTPSQTLCKCCEQKASRSASPSTL